MDEFGSLYLNIRTTAVRSLRLRILDMGSQQYLGEWLIPLPQVARDALERYGISIAVIPDQAEAGPTPVPVDDLHDVSGDGSSLESNAGDSAQGTDS